MSCDVGKATGSLENEHNCLQKCNDILFHTISLTNKIHNSIKQKTSHRVRWLHGNARDSNSGGPGFKSYGWPTWLRFSGFLNLKIAKELVILKDKCRVGPHIPLSLKQYYLMFTISRDLETIVVKMVNF